MKYTLLVLLTTICLSVFSQNVKVSSVKNEKGKWGFVDQNKNIIISYKYDWADETTKRKLYIVFTGEVDEKGEPIIGKGKFGFVNQSVLLFYLRYQQVPICHYW